jgi:hypothetical protein
VSTDQFSARWTGYIQPRYTGKYTFYSIADDGVRLWIGSQLIIDKWRNDGGTEVTGEMVLAAGQKYDIKLEYFENGAGAKVKLEWSAAAQAREVVPMSQLYSTAPPAVVGMADAERNNDIAVYPNPGEQGMTNKLTIVVKEPAGHISVDMINDQGVVVMKGQYDVMASEVSVSIPPVSSGLYLIRVHGANRTWTKKYLIR